MPVRQRNVLEPSAAFMAKIIIELCSHKITSKPFNFNLTCSKTEPVPGRVAVSR